MATEQQCPLPNTVSLRCENGGTCEVGIKPKRAYANLDENNQEWLHQHLHDVDLAGMYCECPEDYTGNFCETKVAICGENEHICFAGGACVENGLFSEEIEKYTCECNLLGQPVVRGGTMCEYIVTSNCENNEKFGTESYCVNGGECKDGSGDGGMSIHARCECPTGFLGEHCEVIIGVNDNDFPVEVIDPNTNNKPDAPFVVSHDGCPLPGTVSLRCENGGTCEVGTKPKRAYANLDEKNQEWLHQHLHDANDDLAGMYCDCPEDYTDNYCGTKVAICGENEHVCLAGGACVENGLDSEIEKYTCECNLLGQPPMRGGTMCEYIVTSNCENNERFGNRSYCVNGGECKNGSGDGGMSLHARCDCPLGFKGEHCEIMTGVSDSVMPERPSSVPQDNEPEDEMPDVEPENNNEQRPPKVPQGNEPDVDSSQNDPTTNFVPTLSEKVGEQKKIDNGDLIGFASGILLAVLVIFPIVWIVLRRSNKKKNNFPKVQNVVPNLALGSDGGSLPTFYSDDPSTSTDTASASNEII